MSYESYKKKYFSNSKYPVFEDDVWQSYRESRDALGEACIIIFLFIMVITILIFA